MKTVIGKKRSLTLFSKTKTKQKIEKVEITDTKTIAGTFNNFFAMIGPNLASKITESDTHCEAYISKANTILHENPLTMDELQM